MQKLLVKTALGLVMSAGLLGGPAAASAHSLPGPTKVGSSGQISRQTTNLGPNLQSGANRQSGLNVQSGSQTVDGGADQEASTGGR